METIRVLVAEDSLTVRKYIVDVLSQAPGIEVVGEAENGKVAIELCERLRPNIVTLDMMMPIMSGLAATEYIMAYCPTPILVVSSSFNRGEVYKTYEALSAGAVDVLEKPTGDEVDGEWEQKLIAAVKLVSRIRVITHPRARLGLGQESQASIPSRAPLAYASEGKSRYILLGASTGGPAAIMAILCKLPPDFPLPILLVIHIGSAFAPALAEWLDGQSPIRVVTAVHGEDLPPLGQAKVLMAPSDKHMTIRNGKICLTSEPERHSCRPSIDVLFESAARELGPSALACLLTGMGRDGAQGLLMIRQAGGYTIAQDESSSVIFGMPREAILLGGADKVLALPDISYELIEAGKKASMARTKL